MPDTIPATDPISQAKTQSTKRRTGDPIRYRTAHVQPGLCYKLQDRINALRTALEETVLVAGAVDAHKMKVRRISIQALRADDAAICEAMKQLNDAIKKEATAS